MSDVSDGYGWLAAVVPAGATRFRVGDPQLATMLSAAGARVVPADAEVEIGAVDELRGDAGLSVAVVGRPPRSPRPLPFRRVRSERPAVIRAARRLVVSGRVRVAAHRARRRLHGLGASDVQTVMWDQQMPARTAGEHHREVRDRLIDTFPQRALVTGRRGPATPTVLDDAVACAQRATGQTLDPGTPRIRTNGLLVDVGAGVLRVGVGPGERQVLRQRDALERLWSAPRIPEVIAAQAPRVLAGGTCGVASWSLESKLLGVAAGRPVTGRLLSDCTDFLLALHGMHRVPGEAGVLLEQAETLATVCPPGDARKVRTLAEALERRLADLPRGFAHGDFFHGNLLVTGDRLTGVVDWEAAGEGRLPLLDLLHLRLTSFTEMGETDWGPVLVRHLLPWAQAGGDESTLAYCRRTDVEGTPGRLQDLVCAYWLDYASGQLRTHPRRRHQRRWRERNVALVVTALTAVSNDAARRAHDRGGRR